MVLPKPPTNNTHHLNHYQHHPPLSPSSVTSNNSNGREDAELLRPFPVLHLHAKGSPTPQHPQSPTASSSSTCSPYSLLYSRTRIMTASIAMLLCVGVSTQSIWQLSRWTKLAAAEDDAAYSFVFRETRNVTDTMPILIRSASNHSSSSAWYIPTRLSRAPQRKFWEKKKESHDRHSEARVSNSWTSYGNHPRILQVDKYFAEASVELHQRRVRFRRIFRRRRKGDAFVSYYYNATFEEINIGHMGTVYRDFERPFYEECEAIVADQKHVQIRPTCNNMHELAMDTNLNVSILSMDGSWRSVWKVDETIVVNATATSNTLILKLLQLEREFDTESFYSHAVDAITMEQLEASPYVVSGYGYCGQTVLTEYAPHTTRDALNNPDISHLTRLRLARDLARGLADLHAYKRLKFSDEAINVTDSEVGPPPALFAHHDINIANTVQVVRAEDDLGPPPPNMTGDERRRRAQFVHVQWNDFNLGIWTRRPKRESDMDGLSCNVPIRYEGPLWRSPEEIRNVTTVRADACDVFSMGNLLFQILNKRQPWTHLEAQRPTLEEIAASKLNGAPPAIDENKYGVPNGKYHDRLEVRALLAAMRATYRDDPDARPTAWQLARGLGTAHAWAKAETKKSPRRSDEDIAALFEVRIDK